MSKPSIGNEHHSIHTISSQTGNKLDLEDNVASIQGKNPFARVPVEVFQRIIHFALGDPAYPIDNRIDDLGCVCRRWKQCISTGGPYWIQIDYPAGESSWTLDLQKARCLWVAFTYNQDADGDDGMGPFLQLILDNMDCCCLLELTFVEPSKDPDETKKLIDLIIQHPAPVLQTFDIALPRRYPSRKTSVIDPSDRKLEADVRFLPRQSGMTQRLTSLSIKQSHGEHLPEEFHIPMDELIDIIRNSPCLKYLAITNLPLTHWSKDKPSTPLVLPDLDTISLRDLPLDFTSCVLSLLVAPNCTDLLVECTMGGTTIDALLDPTSHSLNELLGTIAGDDTICIKMGQSYVNLGSYNGSSGLALVLGDIHDGRGALARYLSFHPPTTLQNVKKLNLSVRTELLDVLSLLGHALPFVKKLVLEHISQDNWEEVIRYLSRQDGPQFWPELDELSVTASTRPCWKFIPDHIFNFLYTRPGIRQPDQEPQRKFGKLFMNGGFHDSFEKTGAWKRLGALVNDLKTGDKLDLEDEVAPVQDKNPFALIPVEIFQRIIHFALGDPAYPIENRIDDLGRVCRRWKECISSGGPYWIQIDYQSGKSSWTLDLQKAHCLWVGFTCSQEGNGADDMGPFLRLILDNMDRCCFLELMFVTRSTKSDEMKMLIDLIIQHPAPVLQTFDIVLPRRYPSRKAYEVDPSDRKLEVDARFIPRQSGMTQRLTSLSIKQSHGEHLPEEFHIPMDKLVDTIRNSPCLEYLAVTNVPLTHWSKDKSSTPLVLPDLDTISLRDLSLDFTSCVLSLLVAPNCTDLRVRCAMGGTTIDALLDPTSHSMNELLGTAAGDEVMRVTLRQHYVHFISYKGRRSLALDLDDIHDGPGALARYLSFHRSTTLQSVNELKLSVTTEWLDILSLLEQALPSVRKLSLHRIPQDQWEEAIGYLSRQDGSQCWPLLDELIVVASTRPYWRFIPDHIFYFLHTRLGIHQPDEEPKRKFGRLFVKGGFHKSFEKTGVWGQLRALVNDLKITLRVDYAVYGPGVGEED
ncbi:hypothetical protein FRB99_006849 [Tulasnella sp. 403]|nr:hypothetical protein FRB99_006849 [Tulasnella sp. 403]